MLKKVLSIILFAAMLMSLATVAYAEDQADAIVAEAEAVEAAVEVNPATKVAFIAVYNDVNATDLTAEVTPGANTIGILVPGTLNSKGEVIANELKVTGPFASIASKVYKVAVVFNGILDADKGDFLSLNSSYLNLGNDELFGVTTDGQCSVLFLDFSLVKSGDNSSGKDYKLHLVKEGAVPYDFNFSIYYVDKVLPDSAFAGEVDYDYIDLLPESFFESTVVVVDEAAEEAVEEDNVFDPTIANAIVTASKLNVRASASADSAVIYQLIKGDAVTVTEMEGNWSLLVDTAGDAFGYVFTKYLEML